MSTIKPEVQYMSKPWHALQCTTTENKCSFQEGNCLVQQTTSVVPARLMNSFFFECKYTS